MEDGRFITNYTRYRIFDQYIRGMNNIDSAQDYKHFLQINGENIINRERIFNNDNNVCKLNGSCIPVSNYPQNMTHLLPVNNCTPK